MSETLSAPPHVSIGQFIDDQARCQGESIFLVDADDGKSVTLIELQVRLRKVARALARHELKAGDSVAYALGNSVDSAVWILGILYSGYRAVAINLVSGQDTQAYVLAHSRTRLVITQDSIAPELAKAAAQMESSSTRPAIFTIDGHALTDIKSKPDPDERQSSTVHEQTSSSAHEQGPDDDALLMYTSGTTGRPKGVVLSHANLLAGGHNVHLGHELTPADRALCVLPLFHINGLCVTLFGPLLSGSSVVIPARFSTSAFWGWIKTHHCSWFSVVPTQISYLLHSASSTNVEDIGGVRFGRSASAPLSANVHEQFEACFGIPLIETMGLTETAAQICSNPMPPAVRKSGSPGVAVGDQIRIVNNSLEPVIAGVEGEVLVRGPNVMQRYFDNESATRECMVADGWLRTGDLGHLDEQGYLYITGRLKELIIKGGENIAPREIDDALYRHPDVVEAAAFAMPCERYGQRVEAAVSLCDHSSTSESELLCFCESIVGAFKRPDRIHFESELPKGPSGKIQRRLLAERVNRQKSSGEDALA